MKKSLLIVCLICLGGATHCWAGTKLNPDKHHFVSLYGGLGAQGLLTNAPWMRYTIGAAPAIGVGYRYLWNGLLVQVGIEGEYTYLNSKLKDQQLSRSCIDSENDPFILHATFTNMEDHIYAASVFVPVMLGVEHHRFYGLVGAKVGMNLYGRTQANCTVTTQAEYEKFIDYFAQMPSHNLRNDVPLQSTNYSFQWTVPMVQLHLELGGRLDKPVELPKKKIFRLYLGAYANYGLLNAHQNTCMGDRITYSQNSTHGIGTFSLIPSMVSNQMRDLRVNPLTIGVKFTCLIEIPVKEKCVMCRH